VTANVRNFAKGQTEAKGHPLKYKENTVTKEVSDYLPSASNANRASIPGVNGHSLVSP